MNGKALVLLLLALWAVHETQAKPKLYKITWKIAVTPKVLKVKCGDVIWLTWAAGYHNIYRSSKGYCGGKTVTPVLKNAAGRGNYKYTVKAKDTKFWFVCTVNYHCQAGMKLLIQSYCPKGRKLAEVA